jgi:single-strand DNA-binding protein
MALYQNEITLRGFIGKDAESKTTRRQRTFVVLSLATKSGYKDKQTNEWVNRTDWHRIVAFGIAVECAKHLKKGDYAEIEGELRSSEFDAEAGEGKKKITVKRRGREVRASVVRKLALPAKSAENPNPEPANDEDAA